MAYVALLIIKAGQAAESLKYDHISQRSNFSKYKCVYYLVYEDVVTFVKLYFIAEFSLLITKGTIYSNFLSNGP